jgi:hypothetical protein
MMAGRALVWASEMGFISHHLARAAAFEKKLHHSFSSGADVKGLSKDK